MASKLVWSSEEFDRNNRLTIEESWADYLSQEYDLADEDIEWYPRNCCDCDGCQ
jgi:hypothetical protein